MWLRSAVSSSRQGGTLPISTKPSTVTLMATYSAPPPNGVKPSAWSKKHAPAPNLNKNKPYESSSRLNHGTYKNSRRDCSVEDSKNSPARTWLLVEVAFPLSTVAAPTFLGDVSARTWWTAGPKGDRPTHKGHAPPAQGCCGCAYDPCGWPGGACVVGYL